MSLQIFKKEVNTLSLLSLLEKICTKNNKYFILNRNAYKKGLFEDIIPLFIETECKPCYHKSKIKYLEKKLTYNTFTTILRQICNFNKIAYTSEIKYDKSTYDIVYYISFS